VSVTNKHTFRKAYLLTSVCVLFCLSHQATPHSAIAAPAGDWPQWRYDAGRGASTPGELPEDLHLTWVRQLPQPQPAWPASQPWLRFDLSYSPVAAGTMLFVPSMVADTVTAYDTETGDEQWRFYSDGPVRFAPIAHQGKVYFGSDDGYLYCVNAADGSLLWRFRGGPSDRRLLGNRRLISTWPIRGGPVLFDGTIYFTAGVWPFMGIFVHAIEAETGNVVWTNSGAGAEYTTQPHNSPAFAALVPRGHLAATAAGLIVPGGRTQPGCYDLKTGQFRYFSFGPKGGGTYHVTARHQWFFTPDAVTRIEDGKSIDGRPPAIHDQEALYGMSKGGIVAWQPQVEEKVTKKKNSKGDTIETKQTTLKELWRLPLDDAPPHIEASQLFLKAGSRFFVGQEGSASAIEADPKGKAARIVWKGTFEGEPWTMLAADEKLFVVTTGGRIYCFGAKQGKPSKLTTTPYAAPATARHNDSTAKLARMMIGSTSMTGGYCVVFGLNVPSVEMQIAEALVELPQCHVIVIDPDADKIDAFRRRMDAASLYGPQVAAHVGDPLSFSLPPYMAGLILCNDWPSDPQRGVSRIKAVFRALRPYGGTAWLPIEADRLQRLADEAGLQGARVSARGKGWASLIREGALPGAADWTHNYADAGNSVVSKDELVKVPLGLLWFGNGPPNDEVLPRHGHGPSPQVAAGRLFIEGADMLRAVDIYTGRLLWKKSLPGLGRFYDSTSHQPGAGEIGSNYVSLEDSVYVVYGSAILHLDAATGRLRNEFRLSATADNPQPNWGYIAAWNNQLIATSTPIEVEKAATAKPLDVADDTTGDAGDMVEVIRPSQPWQYLAGRDPNNDWTTLDYDDANWQTGETGFGYGDDDDRTKLDMKGNYTRLYIRKQFDGDALQNATEMALVINYDDAFIAYLNGREVIRKGIGRGCGPKAASIKQHEAEGYETFAIKNFDELLRPGKNVIAIEGHNIKKTSTDFSLDPYLVVNSRETAHTSAVQLEAGLPTIDAFTPVQYASASLRLVVLDRHTGQELWHRDAEYGFRHNNIAVGADKVFCIDAISKVKLETLKRRGVALKNYRPKLLALDVCTGKEIWSDDRDIYGTFLGYSADYDLLLQANGAARDRAFDEATVGMTAYRGRDGTVVWKDLSLRFSGPPMLHRDTIITQGVTFPDSDKKSGTYPHPITGETCPLPKGASAGRGPALSLLTGETRTRSHPLSGEPMDWTFTRNYGCNTAVASEHLLTFRSAAAGFYDLLNNGGTGNLGGFKSGCTSNLIVAGGLLNAPEYTRTCTCRYQNQTSLAMIYDPAVEVWTFNDFDWGGKPVRRVGINFGAPGDRMSDDGTLWLDYPSHGGPSPDLPLKLDGEHPAYFRYHSSRIHFDPHTKELNWVAASGVRGVSQVMLTLADDHEKPRKYTVRLHFAEVKSLEPGRRVFDVALQGKTLLTNFDIVKQAGEINRAAVVQFAGIEVADRLEVSLKSRGKQGVPPSVLCGLEVVAEGW